MPTPVYARGLAFTTEWLKTEKLVTPTVYPLDQIIEVQLAMEARKTQGKVVFSVSPE